MKEKYFTPDISSLHIGYECETRQFTGSNWFKCIIDEEMYYADDDGLYRNNCPLFHIETYFRTPFLTKEQIEKEGFVFKRDYKETFYFEKGNVYKIGGIFLDYNIFSKILKVSINKGKFDNSGTPKTDSCFEGKIKCINEFRNILKYLSINT